jgi:hypothetical protein
MQAKTLLPIVPFTLSLLFAPSAFAQNDTNQKSTPAGLVDALNGVFGKQTDNRAVHAKGIVLEGKFTPSPDAATLRHPICRIPPFPSPFASLTSPAYPPSPTPILMPAHAAWR